MRTSNVRTRLAPAVGLALLLSASSAFGEGGTRPAAGTTSAEPPTRQELERRIQELENAVKDLRKDTRTLEVKNDEEARNKPAVEWKDGFSIQTPDGDFKLRADGYVHADGRFFLDEDNQSSRSQFLLRRARIDIRGTVFKYFDYRIMPDFAGSQVVLQDAFLVTKFFPEANLWVGKYKEPIGLERLQSALAIEFIERGQPTNIVPNRDLGVMLQGFFFNNALNYSAGVFNGVADGGSGDFDIDDDKDFAGRIFATPFKDFSIEPLQGLGLGIAGNYGRRRGSPSNTGLRGYVTDTGQQTFFQYVTDSPATGGGTAVASGAVTRYSPQAYYYWGPFGSLAEFAQSATEISRGGIENTIKNYAWQVYFTYLLTGEKATYTGVTPSENFNPLVGGWGAWELAFRYDGLKTDHQAFVLGYANSRASANKAQGFTFGVNWYWNKAIKIALNYGHTFFDGGAATGDRENEDVLSTRVQFFY